MKKSLGIIGGMGPLATAELFTKIIKMTDSNEDSGHIHIIIDNNTSIPDRSEAILCGGISPVSAIVDSMEKLSFLGTSVFAMPCNTSHYFFDEITINTNLTFINMIEETAKKTASLQYKKVGILATNGTVYTGIFDKYFKNYNIDLVYPKEEEQKEVMDFIYKGVKSGNSYYNTNSIERIIYNLRSEGSETIILGCTELSIGLKQFGIICSYIDTLDVLAERAIIECGYKLKVK